MSEDRMEGAVKNGIGKLQDAVGGAVGSDQTQAKGQVNQIAGKVQDTYGQAVDKMKDAQSNLQQMVDEEPYKAIGVVLAAGVVLGFLLGRSGRKVVYVKS